MKLFEKAAIGSCELSNRIIRSATFEGMADETGCPTQDYVNFYEKLSKNNIGAIITGFIYFSNDGKAIQPGQAALYMPGHLAKFREVTSVVHKNNGKIFLQIAHAGRQTRHIETGETVKGVSAIKSNYFGEKPEILTTNNIYRLIDQFSETALLAKQAHFDGIQIHAAHGYLIHQFILPALNKRTDEFGIDNKTKIGVQFLSNIVDDIRKKCGRDFPILVKISGKDDYRPTFTEQQFINLIKALDSKKVDAIEISYGAMDQALNIFRGEIPIDLILKHNKIYKTTNPFVKIALKFVVFPLLTKKNIPFTPMYNLNNAILARKNTSIPIICVGGFRSGLEIEYAVKEKNIDFVSMARPFICEPDIVQKIEADIQYTSKCKNCNRCAIMCDSDYQTKCYQSISNSSNPQVRSTKI